MCERNPRRICSAPGILVSYNALLYSRGLYRIDILRI